MSLLVCCPELWSMLSDILKWGGKRLEPTQAGVSGSVSAAAGEEPVVGSKAFPKFLSALSSRPSPVLLDFGPVLGTNVEFYGERLGCKLFIEDVVSDLDRHTKAGTLDALPGVTTADVERRLEAEFRDVATRVAGQPDVAAASEQSTTRASLILEAPAGNRHVRLSTTPLRIGSDASCDLVLRQDGVRPEHALAWQREDVVMLHTIDPRATSLVNGAPMSWAMLEDGDEVRLGEATLRVGIQA